MHTEYRSSALKGAMRREVWSKEVIRLKTSPGFQRHFHRQERELEMAFCVAQWLRASLKLGAGMQTTGDNKEALTLVK